MQPQRKPLTLISPYGEQPRIEPIAFLMPEILITRKAYRTTLHFLEHSRRIGTEFSWVGKVIPPPENGPGQYLITEVKALTHNSTTATTALDALAIARLVQKWLKEGNREYNPLKFWGHTHMGLSVEPSSVDNNQMSSLIRGKLTPKFFIRGIFGLKDKLGTAVHSKNLPFGHPANNLCQDYSNLSYNCPVEFTLFDYTKGIQIRNVPWRVINQSNKKEKNLGELQTTKVSSSRTQSLTRQRKIKGKIKKSK